MVLAILQLCVKEYTPYPWHQWLCYVAILWLAVLLNIFGTSFLPALNQYLREWKEYPDINSPLTFCQSLLFSVNTPRHYRDHPCMRRSKLSI